VLTFDDGYFNNAHAVPVLEEFRVPATFFISTRHVEEQRAFWWDVLYREGLRRGVTTATMRRQRGTLKGLRADQLESWMVRQFGAGALTPVSDCDRPFTSEELTAFAGSRYVCLGNHTSDHAILINYDPQGARDQIAGAQRFLTRISGTTPTSIAYPNGSYNAAVLQSARDVGLEFGLTTRAGLNSGAISRPMELRRFTLWGSPGGKHQATVFGASAK
jgi:peptidoglycan/xylan/chitin deacetylase (PgdA/CDA1 family)